MELVVIAEIALIVLVSIYLGYRMGKGEPLEFNFKKFKPILRTPEQEAKLIEKIKGVKQ